MTLPNVIYVSVIMFCTLLLQTIIVKCHVQKLSIIALGHQQ